MRSGLIVLGLLITLPVLGEEKPKPITFDKADVGKLPASWKSDKTGQGEGSVWKVVADETAPSKSGYALAQTAASPNALFNLCVLTGSKFKDGEIGVRLKAVEGKLDQGGGLVWRYKDANNYYITRYNPLEDNFRVYKVVEGKRIQLATKESLPPTPGKWYQVVIKQVGNKIECYLDGKKHLEVTDDTFAAEGPVGLWSKADAQSHFDELIILPAKP
jgi:hypothetical protein